MRRIKIVVIALCVPVGLFALGYFIFPLVLSAEYKSGSLADAGKSASSTATADSDGGSKSVAGSSKNAEGVTHLPTPVPLKGIYMSQCVAGTPSFRDSLVKFVEDTELNAIVIDVKDFSGGIGFPSANPALAPYISEQCGAKDMKQFIARLHEKGIYAIARITVFQDPLYAKAHPELAVRSIKSGGTWKNNGGLAFIDVGAKPFWDYIIELSKVTYFEIGFDELNYDYIRFPSDGPMADADFTLSRGKSKNEALEEFFKYLHDGIAPTGAKMSADLFGYVTVHTDDLGIGQILERALPYFDYIAPMVYPSHYNAGFAGLKNVNSDPYKVVHVSMEAAVDRAQSSTTTVYAFGETPIMKTMTVPATASVATTTKEVESGTYTKPVFAASKLRPWLQSFNYPVPYTPTMVSAQIKANTDSGLDSYLFWDAGNKYTSLRKVLSNQ